ncbi:unnamed protein product [Acanthosepion pharaonis]|uniref:SAFB-like transcription modulator n=1 Tax=Acanthosepion pharaonis TaxID=158019 RepID=A0A812E627_ACAPH|nr:unnamed protein product [Sepia pharaonis]
MDLTIEDLRSELEKRGLDSAGEQKDLRSRFEKALQDEKEQKKSLETNQTDTSKNTPESEDTAKTKKEDVVQEEAMVVTKEGEVDTEKRIEADVDEKDKAETSKVQTLTPPAAGKTDTTDEKESTNPTLGSTTPQKENTAGNDDAAAVTGNNSVAETKDSAANPTPDDTQNDLDADLLAKEKAIGKTESKKSDATSAAGGGGDGSSVCPPETEAKSNEEGQGDKGNLEVKTEKKADEKKDDKDGKLKSSSTSSRVKSSKTAASVNRDGCNLWISGLSSNTKATHLKGIFAKYGKVVGAKVVTNARSPGARCYGFLTMSSPEEAAKCIQHLNRTKINNQTVTVKSAKTTPGLQPIKIQPETKSSEKEVTKSEEKSPEKKSSEKKVTEKKSEENAANKKKLLEKSSEKKNIGKPSENKKSTEKKPDRVKVKKDGKGLSQSEKVESHSKTSSRSSSDKTKMLSPTKTPSKTSSHSPRHSRHHRSREHSTDKLERDFKLTLELKQRKNYLEREVRRQERQIDHARLVELELQRRQKEEAYRLDRVREELRMEREKLERERLKLERAEQSQLWKERQQADMFNGFERERHAMKRPYDRKTAHNDNMWDEMKRPNMGSSGASTSRFGRSFSDETWFGEHEDNYDRRGDSYYNRDGKPMESVGRFSDSNHGRINHSPQRAGHERYGPPENSSRLADHVSADNRFERRDLGSVGYHGHDTDHRNLAADREREMDRRNVSAHERLGRLRNQLVGGSNWKVDNWSHSHGGMDTGHHQWMGNNMNPNYERGNGVSGSRGFGGGSGSSNSGGAQNLGPGNMFNTIAQPPGMMAGGGGGNNLGSRMQEPRFDAYKNMEHGGNRRY